MSHGFTRIYIWRRTYVGLFLTHRLHVTNQGWLYDSSMHVWGLLWPGHEERTKHKPLGLAAQRTGSCLEVMRQLPKTLAAQGKVELKECTPMEIKKNEH